MDYNFDAHIGASIDLGPFPYLREVFPEQLSREQNADPVQLGRTRTSRGPKLISSHQQSHRRVGRY